MVEQQEEAAAVSSVEPKTEEMTIKGMLTGSFGAMQQRFSSLQLFTVKVEPGKLTLLRVESRDINKRPFLFMIIQFTQSNIDVKYTIALDSSPKLRRVYVLKTLLGALSLVTDIYNADNTELFQQLDSAIDDVLGSLSQNYSTLFNNYDALFNEYRETKRLNIELTASNKNLSVQATQLSEENKELVERLKKLETFSDESLMVMIEDWLQAHDSTIDVGEFANTYKINMPRVEQILNKMVSLGYIELKG